MFARNERVPHYAASTMKAAVLAALYRSAEDWDALVPVENRFRSRTGGVYANSRAEDSDPLPWERLGEPVPLRWLAERMVTHSSNLATNLCLRQVGFDAVAEVWRQAGAVGGSPRGVEDHAARGAGVDNRVSALDLALLVQSLEPGVLALLEHNAHRVDLAAGLPPGVRLAGKNGWIPGSGSARPWSAPATHRPTCCPCATPARWPAATTSTTRPPGCWPASRAGCGSVGTPSPSAAATDPVRAASGTGRPAPAGARRGSGARSGRRYRSPQDGELSARTKCRAKNRTALSASNLGSSRCLPALACSVCDSVARFQ